MNNGYGADSGIVRQFLVDMGGQGDGRAQRRPALVLPAREDEVAQAADQQLTRREIIPKGNIFLA